MSAGLFLVFILMFVGYLWIASDAVKSHAETKTIRSNTDDKQKYENLYNEFLMKQKEFKRLQNLVIKHSDAGNHDLAKEYSIKRDNLLSMVFQEKELMTTTFRVSSSLSLSFSEKEVWKARRKILDVINKISLEKSISTEEAKILFEQQVKDETQKIIESDKNTAFPDNKALIQILNTYA